MQGDRETLRPLSITYNSDENQGKICNLTLDADDCLVSSTSAGRSRRIKKEEK